MSNNLTQSDGGKFPEPQGIGYGNPPAARRFTPGKSGNPAGRPSAGASVKEWFNQMSAWTESKVKKAADDPKASVAKRAAAGRWLDAISRERTKGGIPIAGPELDRIMDSTSDFDERLCALEAAAAALDQTGDTQ
jgi:hypothetical protein